MSNANVTNELISKWAEQIAPQGRLGAQYVLEVFSKAVAAWEVFLMAGPSKIPAMGNLLLLPSEA